MTKKYVNGALMDLTPAEEQARLQDIENSKSDYFNTKIKDLRIRRNGLLADTDWTVLPDSPIADKTDWQIYRQKLRDITEGLTTIEDVEAVEFPTKP
tara:strand:+ start:1445 stop:1735 length:291 start_codon:yes stop_codon:yes gene_type:complete